MLFVLEPHEHNAMQSSARNHGVSKRAVERSKTLGCIRFRNQAAVTIAMVANADIGPTTLMSNDCVTLWYHPDGKIVHHRFEKFPDSETFRATMIRGAECLEQKFAKKWMSDDRNMFLIRPQDWDWGDEVWRPRVLLAGFKYWAVIVPSAAVGKLNVLRLIEHYRTVGVTVNTFQELEDGMKWLRFL